MSNAYEECLAETFVKLEAARQLLNAEIGAYPTPIAGCDLQFNRLLSDRARIANAIRALQEQPFVPTPQSLEPSVNVGIR